jgi:drug/metabolite transporter (DMT)-like permease
VGDRPLSAAAVAALTGVQVGCSIVATRCVVEQTYLWPWALDHAPPTEVTVFLALSPVTATILGATLLGEAVSPIVGVGVALVAAGIWLATRATTGPRAVG